MIKALYLGQDFPGEVELVLDPRSEYFFGIDREEKTAPIDSLGNKIRGEGAFSETVLTLKGLGFKVERVRSLFPQVRINNPGTHKTYRSDGGRTITYRSEFLSPRDNCKSIITYEV
jgi:hypothetical protein